MSAREAESVTISGIKVELSHTGKLLFDDPEITKGELIGYYRDMAGRILPYLRDRPLVDRGPRSPWCSSTRRPSRSVTSSATT